MTTRSDTGGGSLPPPAKSRQAVPNGLEHGWLVALCAPLLLVILITAGLLAFKRTTEPTYVAICYLIPVVLAAAHSGVWPAVLTAALSVGASAYFLYPPIYSFKVDDTDQVLHLALFAVVAAVMGHLVLAMRSNARAAREREAEVASLHQFSQHLATASTADDIFAAIESHLGSLIGRPVIVFRLEPDGTSPNSLDRLPRDVASEIGARLGPPPQTAGEPAGEPAAPALVSNWLLRPLHQEDRLLCIVAVELDGAEERDPRRTTRKIDQTISEAARTLERINVGKALAEAQVRAESETLRQALIGSVSHELFTPLATILGAASILVKAKAITENPRLKTLATVLRDEAERLNSDIQTLLDASRISSNSVQPRMAWSDATDIVNSAIGRRAQRLSGHELVIDMATDLPMVLADSLLIEQALLQMLDNAAKYSPPGAPIEITVSSQNSAVLIAVTDRGVGLTADEIAHIWERFYRAPRVAGASAGSGLGLWVARSLAHASGASVEAASAGAGLGSRMVIRIPVNENSPQETIPAA